MDFVRSVVLKSKEPVAILGSRMMKINGKDLLECAAAFLKTEYSVNRIQTIV